MKERGVLNRVFTPMNISLRASQTGNNTPFSFPFFSLATTKSGKKVNEHSALTIGAFFNAVDLCTNDIAKLPKHVFRRQGDNIDQLKDHPVQLLISEEPNNFQNAFSFWKILSYSALVKGDGFAYIQRDPDTAQIEALVYLQYHDVEVYKTASGLFYKHKGKMIASADMLHIYFFSTNGYRGCGVVCYAANSMGVTLAGQEFMGDTYGSKGISHGVMEADHNIELAKKQEIEGAFESKMNKEGAGHKVAMLDAGFEYKSISITPQEAQWLDANREGLIAVCQFLNVAPHKLKMLDKANYSNLQLMTIEHQQDSVMPRTILIEQELKRKLFTAREKVNTYVKFNLRSQLRGDQKTEAEYLTKLVSWGVMDRNEARKLLELNPKDGLSEPLTPVNMQLIKQLLEQENNNNE